MKSKLVLMMAGVVVALAGCGGGGSNDGDDRGPASEETTVPVSALRSPESFSRFVRDGSAREGKEPLSLMGVLLPLLDTAEPIDID